MPSSSHLLHLAAFCQPDGIAANCQLQGLPYSPCKNLEVFDDHAPSDIHRSRLDAWYKTLRSGAPTYIIYCWGGRCLLSPALGFHQNVFFRI